MTASDGYIKIFRSIDKYGNDPVRLKAWLYLIIDAKWNGNKTGTVFTTWTKLATRWGLFTKTNRGNVPNINQAKRFVKEMTEDGRIEVCKQSVSKVSASCKQEVSILLLNYTKLQGKNSKAVSKVSASCKQVVSNDKNEPLPEPTSEPLIIKNKQLIINTDKSTSINFANTDKSTIRTCTLKNKRGSMRGRAAPPLVSKKKILLDRAAIKNILDEIDLAPFKNIYGHYNVVDTWAWFYEACLDGTAKKPGVNPYKYSNFKAAFSNWLKKAYPYMISGEGGDE